MTDRGTVRPLVSVVVPTFDGETFLRETLDSVLRQTYRELELLVCDDGSTDGTAGILASYGSSIRIYHSPHQGVARARNVAAAHARGEYLAFLDHDDVWEPRMLETQLELLESHPEWALVYGDSLIIDRNGTPHGRRSGFLDYASGRVYGKLVEGNFIPIETALMRTAVFHELGGFREGLFYLEDYDLFLRLARHHPIGLQPQAVARYRIHERNLSHNIEAILHEWTSILEKLPCDGDLDPALVEREIGRRYGELAWHALRRFDILTVDQSMARARSRCPWPLALRVRSFRLLLGILPPALGRWVLDRLPRRRLYGVASDGT